MKSSLQANISKIKTICGDNKDLILKEFKVGNIKCAVMYLRGMVAVDQISEYILYPSRLIKEVSPQNVLDFLCKEVFFFPDLVLQKTEQEVINAILQGDAIILVDGQRESIKANVNQFKERSISEPPTSAVLKGPREGFTEGIKTNISLIRRILSSPDLKSEYVQVGNISNTQVCIMYIEGIASDEVISKVTEKIKKIKIDGIIDSSYISDFLEEHPHSMFKQIGVSEKPDIIAAKMLEGRVAIFVDGSPIILTVPFILVEDLQSSDDYYGQHARATFLRIIRIIGMAITVLLPALYIAIQLYHYKAIPLKFIITIMNSTQGLPLTPLAEILFILILFEILYEASLRMPKYLGLALSIVGALILGDTAVKAGLISPPAVMIVAVSGITLYTIPDQAAQLELLRLFFTLAGGVLGFFGVVILGVFLIIYLNDFDNYGTAYLSPFAPKYKNDYKDAISKADLIDMKTRPRSIPNKNPVRMKREEKRGEQ